MSQSCSYKKVVEDECIHCTEGKCIDRQAIMVHGTSDCVEQEEVFLAMTECRNQMHSFVDTLFDNVDNEQFDEVEYYIQKIKGLVKHIDNREDEIGREDYEASLGNHYTN